MTLERFFPIVSIVDASIAFLNGGRKNHAGSQDDEQI
jgi:hypothetical protein